LGIVHIVDAFGIRILLGLGILRDTLDKLA
jgi:hypothetical protein